MLDDLLHTLMRIMLEHAEAQNGTLLLVRNERLAPMAQASAASPRQVKLLRDPGTAAASQEIDLPRSVIDHVQRGHQPVLIADTANGHPFSDDPYFAKRRVHALLCLPILRQGTLLGALYLEYDRAAARVTPNHLAVLELLASQSAIALENAMLYADLRGREARIRRLVESNIIGIFFWDLKGGIREANDAFLRMIGYTREELLSGNIRWTDVTPPELMARDMHAKQGLERTGSVDPYEKEFIHKDGHRVPVLLGAALFEQSQEEGVAFVLELTAQKRIEAALRKSEQQWRAVFEHNPTMYFMLDAEGRIVAVNPVGAEQLGYTVEELEGQSVLILFAESEWPAVQRNLATCLAHPGHTTSLEICKVRKDGSRLWVRENAKVMPREDDRSIVLVVCEDITERKRAEEALLKAHQELEQRVRARTSELEQSNLALAAEVRERARAEAVLAQRSGELARSNAELEQMAYVASHDLQEPLRMVSSYLQLLEQRYGPQLDGDAHEFIGFAVDGAKRLQTLIDDLLAYSRVGTRAKPLRPIDSKAALDMALQSLRLAIDESGAQVESGPLPCVTGDAAQLTQLFQNLIGNAIKFRGEDAPRISIAAVPADGFWEFAVQDNGIGIAPEYFDRIFVMFQRLHSRRKYPGTGMGLAICKKIVERHGGRIWAEAVPKGTCFKFTLPRISGDESAC